MWNLSSSKIDYIYYVNLITAKQIKKFLQILDASKVVEIDSIPCKFVKLAGILLSGRTDSHSSIIYFHSSRYLFSQKVLFEMLD